VSAGTATETRRDLHRQRRVTALRAVGEALVNAVVTMVVVVALWELLLRVADVSDFAAKGPDDVWRFLFVTESGATVDDTAASHRESLTPLVVTTLQDAALGFMAGMLIATGLALAFTLSKTIEAGVLPFALFLRSVPLVAIAPAILLLTGIGTTLSVVVIGSIVVLFPALAAVMFGLSRASKESLDLVRVYGGGSIAALSKVAIPGAMPSIFAAARVSVPGAVTGAMLAEWLSTGGGVGGKFEGFRASVKYDELWAAIAIITFLTLVLYNLVQMAENLVLARMGMATEV
jgi:ABC-type nitrate/sulfonate/bicarbonate transport system permease component